VKTLCADASVDFVDVKVGHCQALNLMKTKPSPTQVGEGFFIGVAIGTQRESVIQSTGFIRGKLNNGAGIED
jgi:hypothetical protein